MLRQIQSTAHPMPFFMTRCGKPAPGLVPLPLASISKDGGPFSPALGTVIEQGRGWYALLGHAQDRNTLGSLIIDAVASDPEVVCLDAPTFEIVGYDPYQMPGQSVNGGLSAADSNNLRLLTLYSIPPAYQGQVR